MVWGRRGLLTQHVHCPAGLEAKSPSSGSQQGCFFGGFSWLVDGCFPVSSHVPSVSLLSQSPLPVRTPVISDQGSAHPSDLI